MKKKETEKQKDDKQIKQNKKAELSESQLIEKQKKEHNQLWENYLRLQADFDNYKKRSLQDKADFVKFANQGLISELIGILDNFELSIKYADQKNDFKLMHQGVDMIIKQLHTLLRSKGLEKIKTVGENFNPHKHDALEIVVNPEIDSDKVIEELQPGYLFEGRILRPAKVKVAKPKVCCKDKKKDSEVNEDKEVEEKKLNSKEDEIRIEEEANKEKNEDGDNS